MVTYSLALVNFLQFPVCVLFIYLFFKFFFFFLSLASGLSLLGVFVEPPIREVCFLTEALGAPACG